MVVPVEEYRCDGQSGCHYFLNLLLSYMHVLLSHCVGVERRCGSGCGAHFDGIPYLQEHFLLLLLVLL